MDADALGIGDNQQRWLLERDGITLELDIGRVEVAVASLLFPSEVPSLPNIRPAVATSCFQCPFLEGVPLTCRVGVGRTWLVQHPAEVDKMRLRRRALGQLDVLPLGNEVLRRHCGHNPR
jgi:hypothetical protein